MNRMNPKTNVTDIEKELNIMAHNYFIPKEDVQLFAMINEWNYVPIPTYVNSEGNIVVDDVPEAVSLDMFLGTKKQFIYKQYTIGYTDIKFDLDHTFKTAWNPNNFIIFRNGYLLNSVLYNVYCPTFDSVYTVKTIYSQTSFLEGDRIDIFYIEDDDRFKPVKFNHDVFIKNVVQFCEIKNQIAVRIPYPSAAYPRQTEMFYVFNTQTKRYLTKDTDYIVEKGGQYIILKDPNILTRINEDSVTFVFPYCMTEYEPEVNRDSVGEASGISFYTCYYQWEPKYPGDVYIPTGLLEFAEPFTRYTLTEENFILFCNNTYVNPDRYKLINNNTIQLFDPIDIAHAEFAKFTMLIFEENEKKALKYRSFEMQVIAAIPTVDGQSIIDVPDVSPENTDFLVFEGALMFDVANRYTWDKFNKQIIIQNPDMIKAGREIIFIFYTNVADKKKYKTLEIIKIKFESFQNGQVTMTNEAGYDIMFNKKNCVLFMNGTYLTPDRYEINENILTFTNPLDKLRAHKAFTGFYFVSHMLEPELPYDILDDIRDGYPNKLLWFDEMKVKPTIKEIITPPSR